MFSRIAIVNRGEPAMRLINAVREWNAQNVGLPERERVDVGGVSKLGRWRGGVFVVGCDQHGGTADNGG